MYITPEYRELNKKAHELQPKYGARAGRRELLVKMHMKKYNAVTALDYGCGKGHLAKTMDYIDWQEYDPAILGKDMLPTPADFVFCGDVMEHVEPACVDNVVAHICQLTQKAALIIISLRRGKRKLPDGSFAHKIVKSANYWVDLFSAHAKNYGQTVMISSVDKKELRITIKKDTDVTR